VKLINSINKLLHTCTCCCGGKDAPMPHKTNGYKLAISYFNFNQYGKYRIHSSLLGTLKFWLFGANSSLEPHKLMPIK
jgi:hypothetical protein